MPDLDKDAMTRAKAEVRRVLGKSKAWPSVFDPATADLLAERIIRAAFPILAEELVAEIDRRSVERADDAIASAAYRNGARALRTRIAEMTGGGDE